jgi:hypothetical protein
MAGTLRILRRRIRAVTQTKQITKAMELVATSRIAKAQQRVEAALPYTNELTRALSALASNSNTDHPLLASGTTRGGPRSWSSPATAGWPGRTAPTRCARPTGWSRCCARRARSRSGT